MAQATKPVPTPTSITQEYWERAKQGEFVLPYCRACGTWTYYPRSVCMKCMSRDLEWRPASGRGTIYACTVVRSAQGPFQEDVPFVIASVDLEEGTRMMANVLTDDPESVRIDMPVKVVFVDRGEMKLPQVAPA